MHLLPCTNLTCCPMIRYIFPTSYSTEELSAGRPTCSTCNVVHCNTKSTVDQQQRASSRIHGSCILHRSALIHDPWPFHLGPLSPARSWGRQNWTGPKVHTVLDCMAARLSHWLPFPHGVSSRPVWPGLVHRLVSPRALRPMSCRANPSWSCHHHKRHGPFCSVEASSLRIKGHLPAAHAGLSAIGSGIRTDACASRSRSAQGFLQLCSCLWMSRPRSTHRGP